MITSGQMTQLTQLLSSLLVVDSTIAMSRMGAYRRNGNQRERIELVKEFLSLPTPLQKGAIAYAKRMRGAYEQSI